MIIARTPLRISIGGGGSDLPSYYERFGGAFISAAIDKYVYVAINNTFINEYSIRYSSQERVTRPDEIRHLLFARQSSCTVLVRSNSSVSRIFRPARASGHRDRSLCVC